MLSYQINQKLTSFIAVISSQAYLRQTLTELSNHHVSISNAVSNLTVFSNPKDVNNIGAWSNKLAKFIDEAMKNIQNIKVRQIFNEINNIESVYADFRSDTNIADKQSISDLGTLLSDFGTNYDNYLNSIEVTKKRENLFIFLAMANSLFYSLGTIHDTLVTISLNYQNIDLLPDNEQEGRLSILLESEMDYDSFVQKISAINIIYGELCALAGASYNNASPKIIKIESGSLWAEILGYPKIISLLESILEGSIGYMYRTFTREGKLASIPRKVETIESILELRKKLKAVGIDTIDLDENLQKASVIIAQEANNLLVGEPKLTINNRVFSIGASLEKKYLESGRQRLLSDN